LFGFVQVVVRLQPFITGFEKNTRATAKIVKSRLIQCWKNYKA